MYYLRKEPYRKQFVDSVTGKDSYIDFTEDRAVFKSNSCGRYYRMNYPEGSSGTKLWKCKKLQTALQHRIALFNYCNEWFNIYDTETNEPIDSRLYDAYVPTKLDTAKTTQTIYYNIDKDEISTVKPDNLRDYKVYRKGTKLKIYNFVDYYQLWEHVDHTAEKDISDIILAVATDGGVLVEFNTWEEYALQGSPLLKTSWEEYKIDGENCNQC